MTVSALVEILGAAGLVTALLVLLSAVVLAARWAFLPRGDVPVVVNRRPLGRAPRGERLHVVLADLGVLLPSGCGGAGTCGLCRVRVLRGGGAPAPIERGRLSRVELAAGERLACQIGVTEALEVEVPEELLGVREITCRVRSARNVATFIRELILEPPPDEPFEFRAGAFVQVRCPPYRLSFRDFAIEARFRDEWDRLDLWRLEAGTDESTTRAYSLANQPAEGALVHLVVRIATPPPGAAADVPPGIVSSYLFSRQPGDEIVVTGPFGNFHAMETGREMVFVGGGAGMAPMRAHIVDQLQRGDPSRRITFWYGARSRREVFYDELFDRLSREHPRFSWCVALSDPQPDDAWDGPVGFVHHVLFERYLRDHDRPEECEYYLCGPPLMIRATREMLDGLGVPAAQIVCDDFGGD